MIPKTIQLSTCLTLFILCLSISATSQYYWVGGSGNWSDFSNHWATTSGGGIAHTEVPTDTDDVFFDMNSFISGGQTVTMDTDNSTCHSMDWTGVLNNPSFSSANYDVLHVHGDLTLSPDMQCNISVIQFSSSEMGKLITTNGTSLGASAIIRINGLGEWTLQDTFECDKLQFYQGTFHTDGNTMNIGFNFTLIGAMNKVVDLGTSILNMEQWRTWGENNTILITDYTINTTTFYADEDGTGPYTYNDIIFNTNSGIFEGGGNFNHVDISGTAGEYMRFESGMTFVINDLVGTGTRHEPLNLEASIPGNEAYIEQSSGDVTLEYVLLQDMHVSGGANFTADQSEDHGNNVGWNMIPIVALEYYWIGNAGDWEDVSHWSNVTSGTAFYTESPSRFDDVFIDVNSITISSQTIMVNEPQNIRNLDCTSVEFNPTLNAGYQKPLAIYGDLNMTDEINKAINNINFQGEGDHEVYIGSGGSVSYPSFWGGGSWTLTSDVTCSSFSLYDGTVDLNDHNVTCSIEFKEGNFNDNTYYLGNGTINCLDFYVQDVDSEINSEGSIIVCERDFKGAGHEFNHVILVDEGSIFNDNTFETLEFAPGVLCQIEVGTTQTVNGSIVAEGTPASPINITSTEAAVQSTLNLASGTVDGTYLILQDNNATGGATFNATQSIDNGNNTGWNISEIAPQYFYWVGGSGDWSDASNHWASTSGGSNFFAFVPGVLDNVYFDENSFTEAGQILTIDLETVNVHDMDWTAVTNAPHVDAWEKTINVYGSLLFGSDMTAEITNFNFLSNDAEVIDPGFDGSPGYNTYFYFNASGSWDLQSNLTVRELNIEGGTFNTNDNNVWVDFGTNFFGTNGKVLNLGSSEIYSRALKWNGLGGDNLELNGGNSSLTISSAFTPVPQSVTENVVYTFNDLHFSAALPDQGEIHSDVSLNILSIDPGKSLDISSAINVTVNQLICTGTVDSFISIQGATEGLQGVISQASGEVNGQFLNLQDINGTGGATFFANSSNDLGNVSGWIFDGQTQSITFDPILDVPEDIGSFNLFATASSGLDVVYEVVSGPATTDGNTITITGAGPVEVQASQSGNIEYNPASSVSIEFCSNPLQPVITVDVMDDFSLLTSSSTVGNQWFFNGLEMPIGVDQYLEADPPGIYTVQVNIGGCFSEVSEGVNLVPTHINNSSYFQIDMFPNPASHSVSLKLDQIESASLEIFTIDGKLQFTEQIPGGQLNHTFNVNDWPSGIYLVQIRGSKLLWRQQLLKH